MKLLFIALSSLLFVALSNSCCSTKSSVVNVSGPGSSPDTITVSPSGPHKYYLVMQSARSGPGSSPDTIALQAGSSVVIYKSKDDLKKQ